MFISNDINKLLLISKTGQNIVNNLEKRGRKGNLNIEDNNMFRNCSIAIKEWLEKSDMALLVTGARQGKPGLYVM